MWTKAIKTTRDGVNLYTDAQGNELKLTDGQQIMVKFARHRLAWKGQIHVRTELQLVRNLHPYAAQIHTTPVKATAYEVIYATHDKFHIKPIEEFEQFWTGEVF